MRFENWSIEDLFARCTDYDDMSLSMDKDEFAALRRMIAMLKAEPVSQPYKLPDGYVLVPVEPTMPMLDEFDSIIDYGAEDSKDAWSRMLAAAPQVPTK